ncbi:MAG: hypothetical protein QM619_15880 [Micropruina sp.]|uniref:hypothetical protein n=1 Tax=Micropruina sp. TaxID=2737536 RepID=UPI0039E3C4F8
MDLDEAAAELYGADLDDFMAVRTRLVAQARAAKDRPLVRAVAALKKPTRSAWLVNLLSRGASDRLGSLADLAARMTAAHQRLDVDALRSLGVERQQLVTALTTNAVEEGSRRGYQATEAVRAEVAGTIAAAVADADALTDVLAGRTVKPLVYSGFGFPLASPGATSTCDIVAQSKATTVDDRKATSDHDAQEAGRRVAVERATQALLQARDAVQQAESAESDARQSLDRASQEVADLRAELRRAEDAESDARRAASEAADRLHDVRIEAQQAEQALAEATRALAEGERRQVPSADGS